MTIYSGSRWVESRRAALARDDRRCQDCGTQDSLHVHHITPVREFDNAEDAHYLDNLVVLCKHCHPQWEGEDARPRLVDPEIGLSVHEIVSELERDRLRRVLARYAARDVYDHTILHNPGRCCTCHSPVSADGRCTECGAPPEKTPSDAPALKTMLDRVPTLVSALERRGFVVDVDALYDALRHLKSQPDYSSRTTDIWRAATAKAVN